MDRQDWLAKEGDTTNIKITSTNIRRKVEVNRFEGFVSIVLMLSRLGKWQLMSWRDFFDSDFVFSLSNVFSLLVSLNQGQNVQCCKANMAS